MNYSPVITEHFHSPRNVGALTDATAVGEATNEACMDRLRFYLRIKNGVVEAATFQAEGCVPTIAVGSVLSEYVVGKSPQDILAMSCHDIEELLGGLPRTKLHVAILAVEALQNALKGESC